MIIFPSLFNILFGLKEEVNVQPKFLPIANSLMRSIKKVTEDYEINTNKRYRVIITQYWRLLSRVLLDVSNEAIRKHKNFAYGENLNYRRNIIDYLIEQIGGKPAPAVGWALGVERVLELIKEQGAHVPMPVPDAYAVIPETSALPVALKVLQRLRAAGVSVQMHTGVSLDSMGSMKSQFKKADTSGARFALIFGSAELEQGCVAIKPLRCLVEGDKNEAAQAQTLHRLDDVDEWAQNLLG